METIDLLIETELTSAQLMPLENPVLFTDDRSKDSWENIEKIRHHPRGLLQSNAEIATVAGDEVYGTTVDLSAPNEQVAHTAGRRLTNINNRRSTIDEEDGQYFMIMQASRPAASPRPTNRTIHTTSHFNDRSNRSSRRTSRRLDSARCVKREEPIETDISPIDDQEGTKDGEEHSTATNRHSNNEV